MINLHSERQPISPIKIMFKPIIGFEMIKYEKLGALWQSILIVLIFYLVRIMSLNLNGFLFNMINLEDINILIEFSIIVITFTIWVIANWAFSTLTDGEGRFIEILLVSSYSLMPIILISLIGIVLTNVFTLREGAFISILYFIGYLWSSIMLIVGLKIIHQYTLKKTVILIIITIIIMLLILFLGLLIFSMTNQLIVFLKNLYNELIFRM